MKVKRVFKRVLALVTAAVLLAAGAGNAAALNISVSNTVMLTPAGGGVGVVYESFSGAMTAANSGDKLKLLADISLTNYATTKDGVEIVVPSGKTLTITYNQSCSLFESDITVESGGTVAFKISKATASNVYLVMNGDLELKEGATAKMTERVKPISVSGSFQASGVIFNGGYKNSGTLTTSSSNTNGSPFIKWGTPAGNVTGGYAVYNLCRTTPSEKTINNSELYVSRINGTIAVGETVSATRQSFRRTLSPTGTREASTAQATGVRPTRLKQRTWERQSARRGVLSEIQARLRRRPSHTCICSNQTVRLPVS